MTDLVPADKIEELVGAKRHGVLHLGRADSASETVFILHSRVCKDSGRDLRECDFSLALDRGIDPPAWAGFEDRTVVLGVSDVDELLPAVVAARRSGEIRADAGEPRPSEPIEYFDGSTS